MDALRSFLSCGCTSNAAPKQKVATGAKPIPAAQKAVAAANDRSNGISSLADLGFADPTALPKAQPKPAAPKPKAPTPPASAHSTSSPASSQPAGAKPATPPVATATPAAPKPRSTPAAATGPVRSANFLCNENGAVKNCNKLTQAEKTQIIRDIFKKTYMNGDEITINRIGNTRFAVTLKRASADPSTELVLSQNPNHAALKAIVTRLEALK